MKSLPSLQIRIVVGLIVGVIIAYVDNFSFGGEVSPIVIVVLLLVAGITIGIVWNWQALLTAAVMWLCLPMAHVLKKVLGVPDTLHPNTYTSILLFSLFTFVVSSIGLLLGVFASKLVKRPQ
jgi:hypothetical protein